MGSGLTSIKKPNLKLLFTSGLLVFLLLIMYTALLTAAETNTPEKRIVSLTTNGLEVPLGVDSEKPYFGWRMESETTGAAQTAYRIRMKDPAGSEVWDSGWIRDNDSQNIFFEGLPLEPKTEYRWTVSVKDENDIVWESEESSFETSFLDGTYAPWGDAQWIGASGKNLDAASANLFDLDVNITLDEGSTRASVVFGADDDRLQNKAFNMWNAANENYFQAELDFSDLPNPRLNLYIVGMPGVTLALDENGQPVMESGAAGDSCTYEPFLLENAGSEPYMTFPIPTEALENADGELHFRILTADVNSLSFMLNDVPIASKIRLNPLGGTHYFNSFPNLCSIGFAVPEGQKAVYQNLTLHEYNVSGVPELDSILFDAGTGAGYEIFKGLKGTTVNDDGSILVDGGKTGVIAYADPSYGSSPMLRAEFDTAGRNAASARMYVTAQGSYEVSLNGQSVTDGWFNPGNEEYAATMPYRVYDVTGLIQSGENVIGAQLGQGWWSGQINRTNTSYNYYGKRQALLLRMDITYEDGSYDTVYTNTDDWKVSIHGPLEFESHYQGERFNAVTAKAYAGWDTAGFLENDDWETPVLLPPRMDTFDFKVRHDEEAGIVRELPVKEALGEVMKDGEGTGSYIYDMGENVTGVPRITIPEGYADEGDEIIFRYAEALYPDLPKYEENGLAGSMMVENLRAALCTDYYIAADGRQVFEPHFTFHGYRYIEITGLKKALPADCIRTEVLSSVRMTAQYESSNELVNRLFKNIQNSQASNFLSLPTDCPQRNERLGWTGDAQVFSLAASYNADVYNFYRNWLGSVRATQRRDGSLEIYSPTGVPMRDALPENGYAGISWDAALIVIPYNMYMQYGNPLIIEDNMEAIDRYMSYLAANPMSEVYPHLTIRTGVLADWVSIEPTDASLINNAVYAYLARLCSEMAALTGRDDQAQEYASLYEKIKAEWNACYLDPDTGKTADDTQASYATPLRYDVVADDLITRAVKNYVETVQAAGYTITSGFSGTPNLVPVLTENGYIEEAYRLFEQTEYASWLYPVINGATSVWERWDAYTVDDGFHGSNSISSFNHFSLGAILEWMMEYQLGICTDLGGYQDFVLAPAAGGSFTYANGTYESNYGTICSGWTSQDGAMTSYDARIPANTAATLYLPMKEEQAGKLAVPEGAAYIGQEVRNSLDCAVFRLCAGEYHFDLECVNGDNV